MWKTTAWDPGESLPVYVALMDHVDGLNGPVFIYYPIHFIEFCLKIDTFIMCEQELLPVFSFF